jgi:Cu(I)/Ag(I) efflux system protein CusF
MKHGVLTLILGLALGLPAWAGDMNPTSQSPQAKPGATSGMLSEGMVKKVDKAHGKLTLRHGPLENLGMPAMTMNFRVTAPAWLDRLKPGDHIRFRAEMVNGQLTVTRIEVVQ